MHPKRVCADSSSPRRQIDAKLALLDLIKSTLSNALRAKLEGTP